MRQLVCISLIIPFTPVASFGIGGKPIKCKYTTTIIRRTHRTRY
jgi:hypothetical protein